MTIDETDLEWNAERERLAKAASEAIAALINHTGGTPVQLWYVHPDNPKHRRIVELKWGTATPAARRDLNG